ncbi:hypothetical protein MVES1_002546 [Malassezia vespertilionis]|uniref:ENTH domain-containing protein n=1 Tax=Malassezia vespertilionis TaxID=2020962 RepID=A0A2N1JA71_9BASI|nr:uncharacterized protein MVES1_002546 [Malassezia vespertilionis]PKI83459.1 hypothetical protein MVES_002405 [Malassezia vespertilionis]WFD07187.1 hypothetical protein MVES1_002546 [Malassezia vespertilionis]
MSLQNLSKSAVRVGKNYIKGYTDTQIKVREATSNDPWGPSGTQMNELAQLSHNHTDFIEMMEILDKRLNDKGKNWRHVFKALSVLEYLLHAGSENVWMYFHDNIYIVKTLKEFQYIDDSGVDQGLNVRQKAKEITLMLMDEARMRGKRPKQSRTRTDPNDFSDEEGRRRRAADRDRMSKEDRELQRALDESRRMAEEDERKKRAQTQNDNDFDRALRLSREEEEARAKKDNLINLDGDEQTSLQPQMTSFNPYLQFQPTGFNPFFGAQMQQQEMLQQQYMQQQEYQRQLALQNAAQQYQYLMTQQQQQPLMPQQTSFGSNNPWLSDPAPAPAPTQPLAAHDSGSEQTDTLINLDGPEPAETVKPKSSAPPRVKTSNAFPELDKLLASGDGVDTFGNTGDMRMGHAHTLMWGKQMEKQQTGAAALGESAFGGAQASNPFS